MIGVHVRRGDFANMRVRPNVVGGLDAPLAAAARYLDEAPDAGIFLSRVFHIVGDWHMSAHRH